MKVLVTGAAGFIGYHVARRLAESKRCEVLGVDSLSAYYDPALKRARLAELDQVAERVEALRTELTRCGARVEEVEDTLTVYPGPLQGATIETYNDHRMAMCFATVGLKVPGIRIENPSCVKKTFPNFFQKLAAPAPEGFGVTLLDGATGRPLHPNELIPA